MIVSVAELRALFRRCVEAQNVPREPVILVSPDAPAEIRAVCGPPVLSGPAPSGRRGLVGEAAAVVIDDWRVALAGAGIEPWIGARLVNECGRASICLALPDGPGDEEYAVSPVPAVWPYDTETGRSARIHDDGMWMGDILDLADPDTLAAFDRRLALRLGAPEEGAREGVRFYRYRIDGAVVWRVDAGFPADWQGGGPLALDTPDPLVARVLAWTGAA